MHRIDGAGHVNNMFVTEDVGLNRPPTEVTADILNALQEELASFITWAGLALSKPDNTQLRQALLAKFMLSADAITLSTVQAGAYVSATSAGSADAITAAFAPAVAALTAGMVLYVRASAPNATATPTFSPNGHAARVIVKGNNLPLVAGDIAGAGHWLALQYDATLLKWVMLNPARGITAPVSVNKQEVQLGAYALSGSFTGAHTLGARPDIVTLVARCTAVDKGYAIGDEVVMTEQYNVWTMSSWLSTTQVGVGITGGIYAFDKASAANYGQLTVGKWSLFARVALIV